MQVTVPYVLTKEEYREKYTHSFDSQGQFQSLHPLEYISTLIFVCAVATVGFYSFYQSGNMLRNNKKNEEQGFGFLPLSCSLSIVYISAFSFIYIPQEVYYRDISSLWSILASVIASFIVEKTFLPLFYNLKIKTPYEYISVRFGRSTELVSSFVFVLSMLVFIPPVANCAADFVARIAGFSVRWIIIVANLLFIFYTAVGGINSIVSADVANILIMSVSLIFLLVRSISTVGSLSRYSSILSLTKRLDMFKYSNELNLYQHGTAVSTVMSYTVVWTGTFGASPICLQKLLWSRTLFDAKMALYLSIAVMVVIRTLLVVIGLFIAAFYVYCDPSAYNQGEGQLMATYLSDISVILLPSFFFAGLISAAYSTACSCIDSASNVIIQNIIRIHGVPQFNNHKVFVLQMICIWFGLLSTTLEIIPSNHYTAAKTVEVLFSIFHGSTFALFSLGVFVPFANEKGAIFGHLSSIFFYLIIYVFLSTKAPSQYNAVNRYCNGSLLSHWNDFTGNTTIIYQINEKLIHGVFDFSFLWYGPMAFSTTLIVGVIISLITGSPDNPMPHPRLVYPLFDKLFPFNCLPEYVRVYLRCGVDYEDKSQVMPTTSSDDVSLASSHNSGSYLKVMKITSLTNEEFKKESKHLSKHIRPQSLEHGTIKEHKPSKNVNVT